MEQRPGCCYKQEQMVNSCCPLPCQGPEDLSAKILWSISDDVCVCTGASVCVCVSVCLQRELARQTNEILTQFCKLLEADGFPSLRCGLCIGGMAVKEQLDIVKR